MLTLLSAIELSTEYLNTKNVESPRLNAELLLAHVLNCKRMDLYLRFDQPLSDIETDEYRKSIKRRGNREPLQYIVGKVEFFGLDFLVDKRALIPRPETEILVENVLKFAETIVQPRILDIGSGTGNIAISLAKNLDNLNITSIDISQDAINLSIKNAELNGLNGNIIFKNIGIDDFELNDEAQKFDIIVSNPPYIKLQEYSNLEIELKYFEPKEALTDFNNGLSFYERIVKKSKSILKTNGMLFFEIGQGQDLDVVKIMEMNNFYNVKTVNDYQNIPRVIYGEIK
ncbi:MAG: peptide chain release factor N(5)-glutamine methyltransferase [Ignavibacteriales bacterium]|nr:peptide chain release factor N(5)-glutamine methyltransferase [Ignavibacteriales bacterium]MCB9218874.1 peptide chain release factor N(5)-glutamine methyltransferase [Ignavibacteriales bacterium]